MESPLLTKSKQFALDIVRTAGLAGGLHCPYKGLLLAALYAPEQSDNCIIFSSCC